MKKMIFATMLFLAFCSCNNKSATPDATPAENTAEKVESAPAKEDVLTCKDFKKEVKEKLYNVEISVEYPISGNEMLLKSLRKHIVEWMGTFDYEGNSKGTYTGDLNEAQKVYDYYFDLRVKELKQESTEFNEEMPEDIAFESNTEIEKEYETDKIVTFDYNTYVYLGGVHGSNVVGGVTINKADGKELTWDMFKSQKELLPIIKKGLKKYFEISSDAELLENLMAENLNDIPLPVNPPLFTEDGIQFTYQQYEIAAYAAGIPTFEIPYTEAATVLNESGKQFLP